MEHASSGSLGIAVITTIGAFIGALISHFLTQRRSLDLAVYKHRVEAYKGLWEKTFLLPRWPQRAGVTYAQLRTSVRSFSIGIISLAAFILAIPLEMPMATCKKP